MYSALFRLFFYSRMKFKGHLFWSVILEQEYRQLPLILHLTSYSKALTNIWCPIKKIPTFQHVSSGHFQDNLCIITKNAAVKAPCSILSLQQKLFILSRTKELGCCTHQHIVMEPCQRSANFANIVQLVTMSHNQDFTFNAYWRWKKHASSLKQTMHQYSRSLMIHLRILFFFSQPWSSGKQNYKYLKQYFIVWRALLEPSTKQKHILLVEYFLGDHGFSRGIKNGSISQSILH